MLNLLKKVKTGIHVLLHKGHMSKQLGLVVIVVIANFSKDTIFVGSLFVTTPGCTLSWHHVINEKAAQVLCQLQNSVIACYNIIVSKRKDTKLCSSGLAIGRWRINGLW